MNKEELIARARHRIEQKSQERNFSDETVLNMNRECEIKCEQYEYKIKELEAQIEKMKKYLDCDFCEYQNNKDECHQCNYFEKTRWTLKKEIKEK